jgi:uncharacterized protein (TIGR02453 family)
MANAHIPKSGFLFLKKLKKNNNRDWFQKNKSSYENDLRIPLQQVIADLSGLMKKSAPEINFDPKKSIFRINRDVRFSSDKSPYKTNIGASFISHRHNKKDEFPGLYIHVEPGNCFVAGGLYMPSSEQIRKIRESILRDPESFKKIVNDKKINKILGGLQGEKLKKAPKGYSPEHPLIEFLKWKQFTYFKSFTDQDFQTGVLAKKVCKDFEAMMPLVRWLNKAITIW